MPWKELPIMDQLVLSNAKDLARNLSINNPVPQLRDSSFATLRTSASLRMTEREKAGIVNVQSFVDSFCLAFPLLCLSCLS